MASYFSKLLDSVTPTLTNAISSAAKKAQNTLLYGDIGDTGRVNSKLDHADAVTIPEFEEKNFGIYIKRDQNTTNKIDSVYDDSHQSATGKVLIKSTTESDKGASSFLSIPRWGYKDFINERVSWQKSIDSLTGEPGWFYFKIFFKFDTNYGLFPGVLTDNGSIYLSQNSAMSYLNMCSKSYPTLKTAERKTALSKFVKTLSWININAPWFFKKVSGMDKAGYSDLNDVTKEKYIEIECSEDAVDMRLTTLMDMYRYACYDYVNQREIIPENLRKFDMSVVIFHTPLRYYHTAGKSLTQGSFPYKNMWADAPSDRMSFRMVTFSGCEFDTESMFSIPSELNNENAFNIGLTKMKITYNKAFITNLNEWFQTMFSEIDGFTWDGNGELEKQLQKTKQDQKQAKSTYKQSAKNENDTNAYTKAKDAVKNAKNMVGKQKKRIEAIKYAINHRFMYNPKSTQYKSLIDASEDVISNAMRMIEPKDTFGNLYGNYTDTVTDNDRGWNSEYYDQKLKYENGKQFKQRRHSDGTTHRVVPDYANQKPQNQHQAQHIDFSQYHNQDMMDAVNPHSDAYQKKLKEFDKNTNNDEIPVASVVTSKAYELNDPFSETYQANLAELKRNKWTGNNGPTNPMSDEYQIKLKMFDKNTNNDEIPVASVNTNKAYELNDPNSEAYQSNLAELKRNKWTGNNGPTNPMSDEYQSTVHDLKKQTWNGNNGPTNPMSDEYQSTVHDLKKQTWNGNNGPTNSASQEYQQTVADLKKTQWYGNEGPANPMSDEYQSTVHDLKKQTWNGNNGPTNSASQEYQQTVADLKKTQWYGNEGPTNPMSDEYQSTVHDLKKQTWHGNNGPTNSASQEYQQTVADLKKTQWYGNEGPTNPMSDEYQATIQHIKK